MTTKQKAKAVSRLLDRFMGELHETVEYMEAGYAPLVLHDLEVRQHDRLVQAMAQLDVSDEELDREYYRWAILEERHVDVWHTPSGIVYRSDLALVGEDVYRSELSLVGEDV